MTVDYRMALTITAGMVVLFAAPQGVRSQPARSATEFALNRTAKIVCSGVFVSGRDAFETLRNSARRTLPTGAYERLLDPSGEGVEVDRSLGSVQVTLDGFVARARYYGDQGCVILPAGHDDVFFEPVELRTTLPDAATTDWPMGDRTIDGRRPEDVDPDALVEAVDAAFREGALTAAFLVIHRGQIIAERYGSGAGMHTQLESWSMGKSLTATLAGILIHEGYFELDDPAPVAEWHVDPDDPRREIRVRDLLRMSSGLLFSHASEPEYTWGRATPDHLFIYADGIDAFDFAVRRPPEHPPNTVGRYRNADPIVLGSIVRRTVEAQGADYLAWPQKALFDKIGIRRQILETDPWGNFLLTGHDFGTARNWGRLGLLYLRDGVWDGERLLPEGWVDFVSTPAPAWPRGQYGGLFWVNRAGAYEALPETAYYMSGAGGQVTVIVPSHDLVIVRMGHSQGASVGSAALREALGILMDAIEPEG